jgi:hypothetical protein
MSSDYEVFADKGNKDKWLFIDQQGSFWDDECKYYVENYVRNPPDGGNGSGECLAGCKFEKLEYKYHSWDTDVDTVYVDSDGDDSDFSDSGDEEDAVGFEAEQECKWKAQSYVYLYKDRALTERLAKCKVKAKGKAKKKKIQVTQEVDVPDGEGGTRKEMRTTTDYKYKTKCKKFFYHFKVGDGDDDEETPIKLHGKWNGNPTNLEWKSPLFDSEIPKGTWTTCPHIKTKGQNPGMELLIGFLVVSQLKPDDIVSHCSPPWSI